MSSTKPKIVIMSECVHVRLPPTLFNFVRREARRRYVKPVEYVRGLISQAYDKAAGAEGKDA